MYLVNKQIVKTVQEAFDTYLTQEIPSEYFCLEDMIEIVAKIGIPILAHPVQFVESSK